MKKASTTDNCGRSVACTDAYRDAYVAAKASNRELHVFRGVGVVADQTDAVRVRWDEFAPVGHTTAENGVYIGVLKDGKFEIEEFWPVSRITEFTARVGTTMKRAA